MKKTNILNKKSSILVILLFISVFNIYAVKAYKGLVTVKQPDGTQLTIKVNGDEFFRYRTTTDDYLVTQNAAGYYVYASVDAQGVIKETARVARNIEKRQPTDAAFLMKMPESVAANAPRAFKVKSNIQAPRKAYPLTGSPKSLVILANFSDVAFTVSSPLTSFQNLCTQSGYSANGGTGSAKDYFMSSSYGKFSPNFVVVGPVTLPKTLSYYGTNVSGSDQYPDQMIADACAAADAAGVDFTQYDTDNDGYVDNVFVYYAGYNEAEGAATNTIWPHRWSLTDAGYSGTKTFDGKIVNDYSCTSELRGTSGGVMCGVGTFCHEFGHVLGLPDFYHTNSTTYKATLETWDVMDYGPYLNNGCTPPSYSTYERFFLGFLTPEEKNTASNLTLDPLYLGTTIPASTSGQSYLLSATTHNLNGAAPSPAEFFMVEFRKHTGWDTYLGQNMDASGNFTTIPSDGMCIWHIDYLQSAWDINGPNNYTGTTQTLSSHMRCYLQPLSGQTTTPGTTFTTGSFTPTTWAGASINRPITEITNNTSNLTFKLMGGAVSDNKIVLGVVDNSLVYSSIKSKTTKAKNINIKTTSITGDLTVTLTGTDASSFNVASTTITQATANSTGYNLLINYAPLAAGTHSAVLTISGGGLPSPKVINLSGTAY